MPKKFIRLDTKETNENDLPETDPVSIDVEEIPKHKKKSKIFVVLIILLILFLIGGACYYFFEKRKVSRMADPQAEEMAVKKEIKDLVEKVGRLIRLPEGEEPTVATVLDAEALAKEQAFYVGVHNGDKVLVYFKAQKAIIYDPVKDLLVNVGPVFVNPENNSTSTNSPVVKTPEVGTEKINIEVRNGTTVSGKGKKTADELGKNPSFNVVSVGGAKKTDYSKTVLVDLSKGDKSELVLALEKKFGVTAVKKVPSGESGSAAEVLVILGLK